MNWKDIPNFDGYQVSDAGLVRTHNKVTHTSHHGDRHWKNRIIKPKKSISAKRQQERVDLWKDGKPYGFLVARLVAFTFYEADIYDHSLTVNHIDGNWRNNNLNNLELISLSENIKHGFENGLYSTCKRTILTNKNTGETFLCRSMTEASKVMGRNKHYISDMKTKGKAENDSYKWDFIEDAL